MRHGTELPIGPPPTLSGVDDARKVLAERRHRLAPPPWRIFAALTAEVDRWLTLRPREVMPRVVKSVPSSLVEWSSLWPVSPTDSVVFEIEPDRAPGVPSRFDGQRPSRRTRRESGLCGTG